MFFETCPATDNPYVISCPLPGNGQLMTCPVQIWHPVQIWRDTTTTIYCIVCMQSSAARIEEELAIIL
jgi:hypothetical protein